jgi:hypothetical protein
MGSNYGGSVRVSVRILCSVPGSHVDLEHRSVYHLVGRRTPPSLIRLSSGCQLACDL